MCAPDHPLAHARHARQLAGERWIGFPAADVLRRVLAAASLDEAEIVPIDSLTAQKRMVEAGFGLALLPESALDEGELHVLDVAELRARSRSCWSDGGARTRAGPSRALRSLLAELSANVNGGR